MQRLEKYKYSPAVKTLNETETAPGFLVTIIILFSRISLSQKATEQSI
jgi:hypothetical protein